MREVNLQFVPIIDMYEKGIGEDILNRLRSIGAATEYLRRREYDDVSAMSDDFNRVQCHIRNHSPIALYVHCNSKSLNLDISDSCSSTFI